MPKKAIRKSSKAEIRRSVEASRSPKSLVLAESGIKTSHDARMLMSAIISDVISERTSTQIANTVVNSIGKMLRIVEMEKKYASSPLQLND